MRRHDESLSGIAITVQISTASTLKITADLKHAVVMVVEQPKGLQLIAKDQNQVSSMNNEEMMLLECQAQEKTRIGVEVACTVLCTMVVLAMMEVRNMKVECVEDNTEFANYEAKLSIAMGVVGIEYTEPKAEELSKKMTIMRRQGKNLSGIDASIVQISTASAQLEITAYRKLAMVMVVEQAKPGMIKYTKPNVGEQTVPGLREVSAKAVKMLTQIWNLRESLADELSKKVIIMRRQDDILSGTDVTTVQILTTNTQIMANAYKKLAMVEMVVELTKQEGCKNVRTQTRLIFRRTRP